MSLVHKPNPPSSYTSYINDQLRTRKENFGQSSDNIYPESEISEGRSLENLKAAKSRTEEIFFSSGKQRFADGKCIKKKKKKLKPLQVFKRTKCLSKSCEMNLPPYISLDANAGWISQSDSGNDAGVLTKEKNKEDRSKIHKAAPIQGKTDVDCSARYKFYTKENLEDGFIDNVFTLFDRVKLGRYFL